MEMLKTFGNNLARMWPSTPLIEYMKIGLTSVCTSMEPKQRIL